MKKSLSTRTHKCICGCNLQRDVNNEEQQLLLRKQYNFNQTTHNSLVKHSQTSQQTVGGSKADD
uniref:hypothetical protein n=1 Tax=Brasilonema sp. UFV-L1 TaxID=2234130 RepID=UPI0030D7AF1B